MERVGEGRKTIRKGDGRDHWAKVVVLVDQQESRGKRWEWWGERMVWGISYLMGKCCEPELYWLGRLLERKKTMRRELDHSKVWLYIKLSSKATLDLHFMLALILILSQPQGPKPSILDIVSFWLFYYLVVMKIRPWWLQSSA